MKYSMLFAWENYLEKCVGLGNYSRNLKKKYITTSFIPNKFLEQVPEAMLKNY